MLPAYLGVPQAEVDTVQALVCIGAIAAFVTTLRMACTLKTQALLFIQRDAFSIQSSPFSGYHSPQVLELPSRVMSYRAYHTRDLLMGCGRSLGLNLAVLTLYGGKT